MAGDSDVIREFLVRLGFSVDETGSKKFDGTLDKTGKTALAAGKTLLGVGIAAQAMVVAYASSMEKLYYASRRTGASVQNIQALEFGSQKIGIAAGEAQAALEGMSAAVRNNPGLRGLMDQLLGKDSSKMDQAKAMIELVQRLSSMPHYVGAQFAGMFGIDEKTFLMLKQGMPDLLRAEEERIKMNERAGFSAEDAAKASVVYKNSLRDLVARIDVLVGKLSVELMPAFLQLNQSIKDTIDKVEDLDFSKLHLPEASADVIELENAVKGMLDTWTKLAESEPAQNFLSNVKTWAGEAGEAVVKLATGLAYIASGEWKKGGSALLEGIGAVNPAGAIGRVVGKGAFDWLNTWRDSFRDKNAPDSAYNGESPSEAAARRARAAAGLPLPAPAPATNSAKGIRNNNPGNLEFHGQAGATSDGRFARFATSGEGLFAMVAQLTRYNERGLNTIEKVITQWAPPRRKDGKLENNTAAYIDDVSKRMGLGPNQKLNLKDADVLSKLMGSIIGHENGGKPYDDIQLLSAAQARVGDGVTLNQTTNVQVAPGPTAAATAAEVGRAQGRVNGDIVRNMQGAIR